MKCANHPETDAVSYCGQCGRPLCAACRREVRGVSYCENCLAARMSSSSYTGIGVPGGPQPGVALFLGFIPGVGAIYNGQILKAIVYVLIFGSLCALSGQSGSPFDTIFGLGAAAFYCYMVIDSYQTARRKQLGQPIEEWSSIGDLGMNAPVGAIVLIALGALFLLDNFGVHVLHDLGRFWPVLLIAIGVFMLQRRRPGSRWAARHGQDSASGSTPSGDPANRQQR